MNIQNEHFDIHSQLLEGEFLELASEIRPESVNLVVTSPPYNIGKDYERGQFASFEDYRSFIKDTIDQLDRLIAPDGAVCWQTGTYVSGGALYPLDYMAFELFSELGYRLRNRIVWTFNFGRHTKYRLSGRYETLLWFTKGDEYTFNLEDIRVPQLYPGKRYPPGHPRAGQPSGNRAGKNPGDVWVFNGAEAFREAALWELPNLKANHPEKTAHPCQFPLELVERCILAFTSPNDVVLDPFVGSGTSIVAAEKLNRQGIGVEKYDAYASIARERLKSLREGCLPQRAHGKLVLEPNQNSCVARLPAEWNCER